MPVDYDGYLREWRALHDFSGDRLGAFVARWQRVPYALARPLVRVPPNAVTALGLLVALGTLPLYTAGGRWVALAAPVVLLAGLVDQLDGAVAVLAGRVTRFGAVWDSTVDRLTDLVLLAGPALWLADDRPLVAAGAAVFLLEYVRARCQAVGQVTGQVVTPAERPTRVIVAALAALVAGALREPAVWTWTGWGLAALTLGSAAMLLRAARARPTSTASG